VLQDDQEGRLRRELLSLGVEPDSQDTISGEFQARDSSTASDPDPHVFGPPEFRSVSISQGYGSGFGYLYHQVKIVFKKL
jgi:hypothetical protein